jgi:hypothetical protein
MNPTSFTRVDIILVPLFDGRVPLFTGRVPLFSKSYTGVC